MIGLSSATVALNVLEIYKVLSSDPGDQMTFLLGHISISQQLAIFALNGTSIPPKQYLTYSPHHSIIRVKLL